jgi:hypothetical protein
MELWEAVLIPVLFAVLLGSRALFVSGEAGAAFLMLGLFAVLLGVLWQHTRGVDRGPA